MADLTMPKDIEVGQRFGRLTVIGLAERYVSPKGSRKHRILCVCDCGSTSMPHAQSLRDGRTKACGCAPRIATNRTHGQTKTRFYRIWAAMKERCYNPNSKAYKDYGGRGITICDEWLNDFERFAADMGPLPTGYTVERIDNNAAYFPQNCRWATYAEQARNKRNNIVIEWQGESVLLIEAARRVGISYDVVLYRYHLGWSANRILNAPVGRWASRL